jgi:hypothetical protein
VNDEQLILSSRTSAHPICFIIIVFAGKIIIRIEHLSSAGTGIVKHLGFTK